MRPQIFSAGHDTDPEARQGTEGTLVVKPVKVSACSLLAVSLAAAVCAVVLGITGRAAAASACRCVKHEGSSCGTTLRATRRAMPG